MDCPSSKAEKNWLKVFEEDSQWAKILDLSYLGSLNEKILNNDVDEVMGVSEALHEKRLHRLQI